MTKPSPYTSISAISQVRSGLIGRMATQRKSRVGKRKSTTWSRFSTLRSRMSKSGSLVEVSERLMSRYQRLPGARSWGEAMKGAVLSATPISYQAK